MTLFYYFYRKYHGSIINSIEVSLNLYKALSIYTKLQSTRYRKPQRKLQIAYLNIVPKNNPAQWALDAHFLGNKCPSRGLSMPSTWSADAHHLVSERPFDGHRQTV